MDERNLADLQTFATLARLGSFRRAAAALGLTPSAVSKRLRVLEERLGVRLLNRTTRSVALTEAGANLATELAPAFERVTAALEGVNRHRDRPAGRLRVTLPSIAVDLAVGPVLAEFVARYPEVRLELTVTDTLVDIVAQHYDAGIRLGEAVDGDMIAVPVTGPLTWIVVGSPAYFATHGVPTVPGDLASHRCIAFRLPSRGALYEWEFERDGQEIVVPTDDALVINDVDLRTRAALDGLGLAYVARERVLPWLADGRLVQVLADWCPPYPGLSLYYSGRRRVPAALRAFVDMLVAARPGATLIPNSRTPSSLRGRCSLPGP